MKTLLIILAILTGLALICFLVFLFSDKPVIEDDDFEHSLD
jgi:hypothetical protein